jgi:hypothetical protein
MAQGTTKGIPIDIDPLLANNSDLLVPSQKAVKTYTDNGLSNKVSKAGDTMSGSLILNGDPTVAYQAATKSYVDTLINGIDWKTSVNAATITTLPTYAVTGSGQILTRTTNGAIPSATTDNITLTVNQRVLVKNETSTLTPNNGIYIVTQVGSGSLPFILTRASDANTPALLAEATVSVGAGSTLSNTQWHCNPAAVPAIIGTTNITFAQIGSGTYTFNSPLVNNSGVISIPLSTASVSGYLSSTDWTNFNTAYTNRITSLTTTGSGAATLISNVLNIPTPSAATFTSLTTTGSSGSSTLLSGVLNVPAYTLAGLSGQPLATNLTSLSGLSYASTSFVKMTAAGTFALDTNTYITGNQTITLSGQATGSGTTSIPITLDNASVIGKVLTGYTSGAGTVAATDSILQAIQKLNGNTAALVTGVSSVSGTSSRITVSPTTGAAIVDISASYVGQTSITTLGTITTGTLGTNAIIAGVTMTLGSDASFDTYYRNGSGVLTRLANGTTGQVLTATTGGVPSWAAAGGGGSSALSSITAATTTSTINNLSYAQEWQWGTSGANLGAGDAFKLSSVTTAAASNTQTLFNVALSGANSTTTQTTYGAQISNTHTGTLSTNIGLYVTASGAATNNCAIAAGDALLSTTNGIISVTKNSIGTTLLDSYGIVLGNNTTASVGAQQMSPGIVWQGNGYRDVTSTGSQDVRFRAAVLPVQGSSASPTATWQLASSINGAGYTNRLTIDANTATFFTGITASGAIQTSSGVNGNFYVNGPATGTNTSTTTQFYLASNTIGTGLRVAIGGGTTNYTIGGSASYASVLVPNVPVTESGTGTHPIIANVAIKAVNITGAAGATTDAASLYIDGPASGITPIGGLYSILVASGNTKLGGDLYCNGFFSNNNNVPVNSYAELKAGTTAILPLMFNNGTLKTSTKEGGIEYNNYFYATLGSRIRVGVGGVVVSDPDLSASPNTITNTTLESYNTGSNTFLTNGDSMDFYYCGKIKANAVATQDIKVFFGGTVIGGSGTLSPSSGGPYSFEINGKIMRLSSTELRYSCTFTINGGSPALKCESGTLTGLTLTGANAIELKSQATGTPVANDIEIIMNRFLLYPVAAL